MSMAKHSIMVANFTDVNNWMRRAVAIGVKFPQAATTLTVLQISPGDIESMQCAATLRHGGVAGMLAHMQ
jgi:hypothetical protein